MKRYLEKQWWNRTLHNKLTKIGMLSLGVIIAGCAGKPADQNTAYDTKYDLRNSHLNIVSRGQFDVDLSRKIEAINLQPADFVVEQKLIQVVEQSVPKVRYDGNGYPILMIYEDFAEAWELLLSSLESSRLSILDQDRSAGIIYLRAVEGAIFNSGKVKATQSSFQLVTVKTVFGVEVSVQLSNEVLADIDSSSEVLDELIANLGQ